MSQRIFTTRSLAAAERDAFAGRVGATIGSYGTEEAIEGKTAAWLQLLALPRQLIPTFLAKRKLVKCTTPSAPLMADLKSREQRASQLAREGHLGRAVRTLAREELPQLPDVEVLRLLKVLHPEGAPIRPQHSDDAFMTVEPKLVLRVVKNACSGAAPGPSGWTEELVLAAFACPAVVAAFPLMLKDLLNGHVQEVVLAHLRASSAKHHSTNRSRRGFCAASRINCAGS